MVGVHVGYVDTAMAAHATDPKMDPADLVTTPVGQSSPAWVKTIKPAILDSDRLKMYDHK